MSNDVVNIALLGVAGLLSLRFLQYLIFRIFPILFSLVTFISNLVFSSNRKEGKNMNLLGTITIPKNKAGLVFKKGSRGGSSDAISFDGKSGYQAKLLSAGKKYHGYWSWKYDIELIDPILVHHDEIGLVVAKQGKKRDFGTSIGMYVDCDEFQDGELFLKSGGYEGKQSRVLTERQYFINPKLFDVITTSNCQLHDMEAVKLKKIKIKDNELGVVSSLVGSAGEYSQIKRVKESYHDSFQNIDGFIDNGGMKGIQEDVLQTGEYSINPWCVDIKKVPITHIPNGTVGVVVSHTGTDAQLSADGTVEKGEVGVWRSVLQPRNHAINLSTKNVYVIPTMEITLVWSDEEEKESENNYDIDLKPITIVTKDRFPISLKLSQTINIKGDEAPKLISRILDGESMDDSIREGVAGNKYPAVRKLISRVIKSKIQKHFESISREYEYLEISANRSEIEESALSEIQSVLNEYGVEAKRLSIFVGYNKDNPIDKIEQKIAELKSEDIFNKVKIGTMDSGYRVKISEAEKDAVIGDIQTDAEIRRIEKIMSLLGEDDYKEFERLRILASMKLPNYSSPNLIDHVYSQFTKEKNDKKGGTVDDKLFIERVVDSLKNGSIEFSHKPKAIKSD